ncbi:MAG: IclR family transcriptional regulator [Lachnospiraceae bacterium]|jgi:DNA-binding IclR family transcriptional regulator|nr:IclR family transcriptional regulator [Lachnospiraceae bacterium]
MPNTEHKPTERVLNILQLLAANPSGLSMSDIAKKIDSPKTTIAPILHTMAERNFIVFHKNTNLYSIGIETYLSGLTYSGEKSVIDFIKSEMEYAVDETNEICQFGIRSGSNVLYIAKVDSKEAIRLSSRVGKRFPLYSTALGKALLYQVPFEKVDLLFPDGLKPITEYTITDFNRLHEELSELNKKKLAYEKRETNLDVCCYATPICSNGKTIASLSISVPIYRDSPEKALQIEDVLRRISHTIEQYLLENNYDENTFTAYDGL